MIIDLSFEWDENKNKANIEKHSINFKLAQRVFLDKSRVIARDLEHSEGEDRFFCIGRIDDEIVTVRFTYRDRKIRIFGAGYWRKGRKLYEEQNKIYKG